MDDIPARVKELAAICNSRGWKLGTAESCTGGLVSALITAEASVSSFFVGSVVSYARSVKIDVLGISPALLATSGEVNVMVARAMAQGVRRTLKCDWGIGITGIAGPGGGTKEKPVGLVCFGVAGPGFESVIEKRFEPNVAAADTRRDIQRQAAVFAFDFLLSGMR